MGQPRDTNGTDPRVPTLQGYVSKTGAPADAPAGAGGNGYFKDPRAAGRPGGAGLQHQITPAGSFYDSAADGIIENLDGVRCVLRARLLAELYVPGAVLEETGQAVAEVIKGLVPGLLMSAAFVGLTTVAGAGVGALLGLPEGGVGAIPGAALGAKVGFDVGVFLLTWIGVGFLIDQIKDSLGEVTTLVVEGVGLALGARLKSGAAREAAIEAGARKMAEGIAVFVRVLLEGVVLYVVGRGAVASTERLASLLSRMRRVEKLAAFADWVEVNIGRLIKDPRTNPNLRNKGGGGAPGGGEQPAPPRPPQKPPQTAKQPAASKSPVKFSDRQLQKKYKHAGDFGVEGNYSPANAKKFQSAMESHINAPGTKVIKGTYHKQPATHYVNPSTGLNVVKDGSGNFVSGWKLSPAQLKHVMTTGDLGGG